MPGPGIFEGKKADLCKGRRLIVNRLLDYSSRSSIDTISL